MKEYSGYRNLRRICPPPAPNSCVDIFSPHFWPFQHFAGRNKGTFLHNLQISLFFPLPFFASYFPLRSAALISLNISIFKY